MAKAGLQNGHTGHGGGKCGYDYHRCVDAWNSLSDDVVCAPSVSVFKYRLKRFLMGNGFTSKF